MPGLSAGADYRQFDDAVLLGFGTIMTDDETVSSSRVIATAGPGVAVVYHGLLEQEDQRLEGLPNADRFRELANELPGRLERLAEQGITEVAFQPMGDIDRELTAFAAAAGLAGR